MKIKCSWCGSWINDYDKVCPNCGGTNENFKRQGTGVPQTIAELKEWAVKHNLPLSQMRTYIGENYTGAKAFGIYKDEVSGNFIVYKNKADGTRAIRYEGPDEAYAVNELYQKMKERVAEQKSHQTKVQRQPTSKGRPGKIVKSLLFVYVFIFVITVTLSGSYFLMLTKLGKSPSAGYYNYSGNMYYWQNTTSAWYIYDYDAAQWNSCYDNLDYLYDNYDDYRISSYSYSDYDVTDFTESDYYVEPKSSSSDDSWDNDWDDDYSWDSGSDWDSSWDNWDSDW